MHFVTNRPPLRRTISEQTPILVSGLLLLLLSCTVSANNGLQAVSDCDVGIAIKAVHAAVTNYSIPTSIDVIVRYGTDSRYYLIVRGWLTQEPTALESQSGQYASQAQQQQLQFLRSALRRIDLE